MKLQHFNLLIKFYTKTPLTSKKKLRKIFLNLAEFIDMEPMHKPKIKYIKDKGNEGLSAFLIIKTSHISCHIWEKLKTPTVHLDVYSCKHFDPIKVLKFIKKQFYAVDINYKYLNREYFNEKY